MCYPVLMHDQLKNAIITIQRVKGRRSLRLKRGLMRREQMRQIIEAGIEPTGPRADWLRQTANRLIQELGVAAEEFNAANPDDLISANDFVDAMTTAIGVIKSATEK